MIEKKISDRVQTFDFPEIVQIRKMALGMKDIISLETVTPNFPTPEHIACAGKKAIDKGHTRYTQIEGLLELREAIARNLKKEHCLRYNPESEVSVMAGAREGIYNAIQATVNPGDEVIVLPPTDFLLFRPILLAGGIIRSVPRIEKEGWSIDIQEIRDTTNPKTKMIILCSPNNPTGKVATREELVQIAHLALEDDLIVLYDQVYDRIVYDGCKNLNIASIPGMKDRTIIVDGVSKRYSMTGFRIGWVIANEEIMASILNNMHYYVTGYANTPGQFAALAALTGPQDWFDEWLTEYYERRNKIVNGLNSIDGISCVPPDGGLYVFPRISEVAKDSFRFAEFLLKKEKILVTPGRDWGETGEGHVRLCYANVTTGTIQKALHRIQKGIDRWRTHNTREA